jgi:hypothetical protein
MNYSSRFFLYAPLVLFLALAVGAGANWWIVAGALSRKLDALNGRPAMPGVTLSFSSKRVSGFPFNLDVVFKDFRVEVETGHGPSSWTSQDFAIHALAYGREQMIFEAAGGQLLTWTDLERRHHVLPFEVGEWHASSIVDERGLERFDMDLIGFGSPALTLARAQLHARLDSRGAAVDIAGEADAVRPSSVPPSLFGDTIAQARLVASAMPSRSFDAIRLASASWEDTLETWRKAGGRLRIDDLELSWNRLGTIGKGNLSLDAAHSVSGYIDFKLSGIQTLRDAASRSHVGGSADHGVAAALLVRAGAAGSGEAGLLGAVVIFRDGFASVGDVIATTEEPLY